MHGERNGASAKASNGAALFSGATTDVNEVGGATGTTDVPVQTRMQMPFAAAEDKHEELELWEIVAALKRRGYLIALLAIVGLFCGLAIGVASKKKYSATATVEFAQPSMRAFGLQDSAYSDSDVSTLELLNTELKTQEAEITDEGTALAVIQQLHLDTQPPFAIPAKLAAKDPLGREQGLPLSQAPHQRERVVRQFEHQLSVDVVKGTRLLNITFTDTNPERAAAVANAVVTASMDQTAGRRYRALSQVSTWLSDQLTTLKQRVQDSQQRVEAYENANKKDLAGMTLSPLAATAEEQRSALAGPAESVPVSRLLMLNNQLTSAQVARLSKEAIYRVAETGDPEAVLSLGSSSLVVAGGADSSLAPGNNGLALLQHLREQQVQVQVQIAAAGSKYGEKSQTMLELRRQQAEIDAQVKTELGRIRERAHNDLVLATQAEDGLKRQVDEQQNEVSQWSSKADHLLLLQGEAASSRALYQELFAKLQESNFAAGIRASHIALLDSAQVPTGASSPKRTVDMGIGLLIGMLVGCVAAFAVELLDDSLHSEQDVKKTLPAPVLASIPRSRPSNEQEPWIVAEPRSSIAEAYRGLRARIFPAAGRGWPRVLLVASGRPAEGKATACMNTAAALAMQGHSVLVLNADMRREIGPKCYGTEQGTGLSSYLTGRSSLPEVLTQPVSGIRTLSMLASGPAVANASELLSSSRFRELMKTLRSQFEFILIDAPPALLFSDARVLLPQADGYILVVRASRTLRGDLRAAAEELQGVGGDFLGVLMTATKPKRVTYSKYGYGV